PASTIRNAGSARRTTRRPPVFAKPTTAAARANKSSARPYTHKWPQVISISAPKADVDRSHWHVRYGPQADIGQSLPLGKQCSRTGQDQPDLCKLTRPHIRASLVERTESWKA